jgi:type IV pilus assembly protein PilV
MISRRRQAGVSLIEVLVSLLILGIGLLGAAALQMNALKFTDSSTLSSQASFIAYDMMDRIRANPDGNYALAGLASAPAAGDLRTQDLADFAANVKAMGGTNASSITVVGRVVTIVIVWNDSRAAGTRAVDNTASTASTTQTYTLVSRVALNKGII